MDDIEELKRLAGIGETYNSPTFSKSPAEKRQIERDQNIKPGANEWFALHFGDQPKGQFPVMFRSRKKS